MPITPGRIRQMPRAGELEGLSPEEGGERGWLLRAFGPGPNGLVSPMWTKGIDAG